jgi:hypothetical protein
VTRVHVVVEGQTEESFINEVLAPVLWPHKVYLTPRLLGSPGHKGGNINYPRVRKDVVVQLRQDSTAYCSTMFDLYGLGPGFPGTPPPGNLSNLEKVTHIEEAIKADLVAQVPELRPDARFLPYLQLHEYEGLLFSDPAAFALGIGQRHLAEQFEKVRAGFATPEDINDDPDTAPSRRVLRIYPLYRKVLDGTLAARVVGVAKIQQECPHFREWVGKLEALAASG